MTDNTQRVHACQEQIDADDYTFTHDDSSLNLFTKEALGKFSWFSGWDLAALLRYAVVAQVVTDLRTDIEKPVRILDVGCSRATFYTFWMTSFANPGRPRVDYVGLEVQENIVKEAQELYAVQKGVSKCTVHHWDAMRRPITELNQEFDLIIMQEVLEHVGIPVVQQLLADAQKCLAPGGTIVVSSPNPKKHEGEEFIWEGSHVYEFAHYEMMKELDDAGFAPIDIKGWLGKARYLKPRFDDTQMAFYEEMRSVSSGFASAVMALVNPMISMCYTIVAKRPDEIKPKLREKFKEKFAKYYVDLRTGDKVVSEKKNLLDF